MENDKAVFHELTPTNPPFDHSPPRQTREKNETACGAMTANFINQKGKDLYLNL